MKIYIDGKYYDKENATISVFDHGFLYGDGIFEGIRIYNGKIFRLKEHIDRLFESAEAICLKLENTKQEVMSICEETVKLNNKKDGYIRLVVSRGNGNLGINPFLCEKSKLVVIVDDISVFDKKYYEDGIELVISKYRRTPKECLNPRIKSLNYLNNILAKIEAIQKGFLEAIMLNTEGYVTECTGDNIFIVKDNTVITTPADCGALEGVTRNTVMELAKEMDYSVKEQMLKPEDLYNADECFLTGTAVEIIPVTKIDGKAIANAKPGKITQSIISRFREVILI